MNPLKISAQFAAYVWYSKHVAPGRESDAAAFAKSNWLNFLPMAHRGLGRLLGKIMRPKPKAQKKQFRNFSITQETGAADRWSVLYIGKHEDGASRDSA